MITASDDGTAVLWDAAAGTRLQTFTHSDRVYSARFDASGERIVTASHDGTAVVWDAATGKHLATLEHETWVNLAAFLGERRQVMTAAGDGTARRWDVTRDDASGGDHRRPSVARRSIRRRQGSSE